MQLCALASVQNVYAPANPRQMTCNLCVTDLRTHAGEHKQPNRHESDAIVCFIGVDARHFDMDVSVELSTHLQ